MPLNHLGRRQLLKAGAKLGLSAAASASTSAFAASASDPSMNKTDHRFPKLTMITRYSPERLNFAAKAGYECVELVRDDSFTLEKLSDSQIDEVKAQAAESGIRILSLECGWINHIDANATDRREGNEDFVRGLELAHRLGCSFVGTLSGGMPGKEIDSQVKAFSEVLNEKYVPVCERLNLRMGWENFPDPENFATVPATWRKVFAGVPSRLVGLEFDPSHLVRQFIDPVAAASEFRDRIFGFHAKDTEIIQPVLQDVGIHGKNWWRYRIPGQGSVEWPKLLNVLLESRYAGGVAVEHEDPFWDEPGGNDGADMADSRKDGFILAARFLSLYLPGRLSSSSNH